MIKGKMSLVNLAVILVFLVGCEKNNSKTLELAKKSRADLIDTEWNLLHYTVGKKQDSGVSNLDFSLHIFETEVGGKNGCNGYGMSAPLRDGSFTPEYYFVFLEDGTIASKEVSFTSTAMDCGEEGNDVSFTGLLKEAKNFNLKSNSLILTGVDFQLVFERKP